MRELVEAFENLLVSAMMHGGDAAEGSERLLNVVDWKRKPKPGTPRSVQVVDDRLEEACRLTGGYGSTAASVCEATLAVADQLTWEAAWGKHLEHADIAALAQNWTYASIIGPDCPLEAEGVYMGLSLQGPDLLYPMHAHQADELYWVVGGNGDWKTGIEPWFAVEPGDIIVHGSGIRHAMQTNHAPLLTVWAWWNHLDSPLVFVRA